MDDEYFYNEKNYDLHSFYNRSENDSLELKDDYNDIFKENLLNFQEIDNINEEPTTRFTIKEKTINNKKDFNLEEEEKKEDYINKNIDEINKKDEIQEKEVINLGKKRKRERKGSTGVHNKFSDDNVRRKIKHIIIDNLKDFINGKIKDKYKNNLGKGVFIKQLLTLNQKQKSNANAIFNQNFLNKTLYDIFSDNISKKYTLYPLEHNKKVIDSIINDKDINISIYFKNLFALTFTDCLMHFRGDKKIEELNGLNGLDLVISKYENDEEYYKTLIYYFYNYEELTNKKIPRNRKKNNIENENK